MPSFLTRSIRITTLALLALIAMGSHSRVSACTPTTCQTQGANCGSIVDSCTQQILSCGNCPAGQVCGPTNTCAPISCTPTTCGAQGKTCGPISDNCGNVIQCGSCPGGQTCFPNGCATGTCTPTTCAAQGKSCGPISDGCGSLLQCGSCPSNKLCVAGACTTGCTPTTCAAQGKGCGPISDGCGGILQCGSCPSGQTCSAANACVAGGTGGGGGTCTPTTCQALGKSCGSVSDGCGNTLQCGSCPSGQICGATTCVVPSVPALPPPWRWLGVALVGLCGLAAFGHTQRRRRRD
jgi:hypothetical protein